MIGLYGSTIHGRILSVRDEILGDHLSDAAVATDTVLLMDDLSVFSETGGRALLVEDATDDELVTYAGFNAVETGLVLSTGLLADHEAGTVVEVYPQITNRVAYVQPDDADREPIPVRVPFSLKDRVPIGPRADAVGEDDNDFDPPEEAVIELKYREWWLADVPRKDVQIEVTALQVDSGLGNTVWSFTDFLATPTNLQSGDWVGVSGGTGAAIVAETVPDGAHRGVWELQTGTTSTGSSRISTHAGTTYLGGGRIRIGCLLRVPGALSDGTNRYTLYFGLMDTGLDSTVTRGAIIRYRDSSNGGYWSGQAMSSGGTTTHALDEGPFGGSIVTNNIWYLLEVEVSSSGDRADFYIDGARMGSISGSALPGPSAQLEPRVGIEKSIGTTSRGMDVDYMFYREELSQSRI